VEATGGSVLAAGKLLPKPRVAFSSAVVAAPAAPTSSMPMAPAAGLTEAKKRPPGRPPKGKQWDPYLGWVPAQGEPVPLD